MIELEIAYILAKSCVGRYGLPKLWSLGRSPDLDLEAGIDW